MIRRHTSLNFMRLGVNWDENRMNIILRLIIWDCYSGIKLSGKRD